MKRLKDNKHVLLVLRNADPKLRKMMLKHASPEIIKTICEIAYNVLYNNVKICKKTQTALRPYKNTLRKISKPQHKIASTRKILVQSGGSVIPLLIGTVLSILSNL